MGSARFGRAVLLVVLVGGTRVGAQEVEAKPRDDAGAPARPDQDAAKRLEQYKRAARQYTIALDAKPPVNLTLRAEPVLRWHSPLRTAYDGVLFVWTADGRPEVAATFYRNIVDGAPYEQHEFQSLALTGVTASYAGAPKWNAREAGITFEPIPDAPRPAANPAARLRQMRKLAEQFRAEVTERNRQSPLRLLNQPLYRYEIGSPSSSPGKTGPIDGALFGFVHGSDPEVLLVIEDRPADGAPTWFYGFARMSGYWLEAWHKDHSVWKAGPTDSSYTRIPAPEQPTP